MFYATRHNHGIRLRLIATICGISVSIECNYNQHLPHRSGRHGKSSDVIFYAMLQTDRDSSIKSTLLSLYKHVNWMFVWCHRWTTECFSPSPNSKNSCRKNRNPMEFEAFVQIDSPKLKFIQWISELNRFGQRPTIKISFGLFLARPHESAGHM